MTMSHRSSDVMQALILGLPRISQYHRPDHEIYALCQEIAQREAHFLFHGAGEEAKDFGPFGAVAIPYHSMGAVDSVDLFGLNELIIFSFYWLHRERYRNVLDIGGNLGLHAILLDRCGSTVTVFEPDTVHFAILQKNLALNHCQHVTAVHAAVSSKRGNAPFVRVLGNTTSSHLQGSKTPYGQLETYPVRLENFCDLIGGIDLVKMDVEGHEKDILLSTRLEDWKCMDALVEVGSSANGREIFAHLQRIGVTAYAQKIGWEEVQSLEDMPMSHRDGTLFISQKGEMPW